MDKNQQRVPTGKLLHANVGKLLFVLTVAGVIQLVLVPSVDTTYAPDHTPWSLLRDVFERDSEIILSKNVNYETRKEVEQLLSKRYGREILPRVNHTGDSAGYMYYVRDRGKQNLLKLIADIEDGPN